MKPAQIRQICFTVAVVSIALGTATGLAMIWGAFEKNDTAWKFFLTFLLLTVASMLALGVTRNLSKDE